MENTNWVLDPSHSVLQFNIKHLMIATLRGTFNEIEGTVEAGADFENAKFSFTAAIDSVDTNDEKRDAHLKGADFFEADKFPKLRFTSTRFIKTGDATFEMTGNLTIKDSTKSVILLVDYGGTMKDPWGNLKAGFALKGKINRKDFGLTWNAQIEAGGTMLSEEVVLIANIELLKK
jgi:polyisoprenoid-binding protein YceI